MTRRSLTSISIFVTVAVALLAGCGTNTSPSAPSTRNEEGELTSCLESWNSQPLNDKAGLAERAVTLEEFDAWLSIYEGPSRNGQGLSAPALEAGACLLAVAATGEVLVHTSDGWKVITRSGRGPIFETAMYSQAANRAEILYSGSIQLVASLETLPPIRRCVALWNLPTNEKAGELASFRNMPPGFNEVYVTRYRGAPFESTFGGAVSDADVAEVGTGDCLVIPPTGSFDGLAYAYAEGKWIFSPAHLGGRPRDDALARQIGSISHDRPNAVVVGSFDPNGGVATAHLLLVEESGGI